MVGWQHCKKTWAKYEISTKCDRCLINQDQPVLTARPGTSHLVQRCCATLPVWPLVQSELESRWLFWNVITKKSEKPTDIQRNYKKKEQAGRSDPPAGWEMPVCEPLRSSSRQKRYLFIFFNNCLSLLTQEKGIMLHTKWMQKIMAHLSRSSDANPVTTALPKLDWATWSNKELQRILWRKYIK